MHVGYYICQDKLYVPTATKLDKMGWDVSPETGAVNECVKHLHCASRFSVENLVSLIVTQYFDLTDEQKLSYATRIFSAVVCMLHCPQV